MLGVEEEFHVVDLHTRRARRPRGRRLLDQLAGDEFSAELQRCVVETQHPGLRAPSTSCARHLRRAAQDAAIAVAGPLGSGHRRGRHGAAGRPERRCRSRRPRATSGCSHDYQLLVREQLICGAQVHVDVADRDVAVRSPQRVAPVRCPCCSRSRPARRTGWARTPATPATARWSGSAGRPPAAGRRRRPPPTTTRWSRDLIASGTISDPGMIYFDVRPSAHLPTVELRVADACPRRRRRRAARRAVPGAGAREGPRGAGAGAAAPAIRPPLLRGRDVAGRPLRARGRPARPAPLARSRCRRRSLVGRLVDDLRPQLEARRRLGAGARALPGRRWPAAARAARQRRAYGRRGRLADVVDLLLADTRAAPRLAAAGQRVDPAGC